MNFLLPPELQEFSDALGKKLAEAPTEKSWVEVTELGALIAGLPEDCGGLGFGLQAEAAILERAGYALTELPLFETLALGSMPLRLATGDAARAKLTDCAARGAKLTGALQALWETPPSESGGKLSGVLRFVPAFEQSDFVVLVGADGALFSCEPQAPGLTVNQLETLDLKRKFVALEFNNVAVESLGTVNLPFMRAALATLAVTEMVGAARRVADMTIEYVKTRKQFGAAIGSFQAVQHQLANVELWVQQVQALSRYAAWAGDKAPESFIEAATGAKALASEVLPRAMEVCLQLHGGIGFTHEYELHHYLRRVQVLARLFGGSGEHQTALAANLLA